MSDDKDFNITNYSEFKIDLENRIEAFSSSFSNDCNISHQEEYHLDIKPLDEDSSLQISNVSSFLKVDVPLTHDLNQIRFSDLTWHLEWGGEEHSSATFQTQTAQRSSTEMDFPKLPDNLEQDKEDECGMEINKDDSNFIIQPQFPESNENEGKINLQLGLSSSQKQQTKAIAIKPQKVKTNEKKQKVASEICAKKFNSEEKLKSHKNTLKNFDPSYPCVLCKKSFRSKYSLKRHNLTHVTWEQLQMTNKFHAKCYFCPDNNIFVEYLPYEHHLNTHTHEQPYKCSKCPKRFSHPGNLKQHQLIHSKDMRFKCKECAKTFNRAQHLRRHEIVHLDKSIRDNIKKSSKYQCKICSKKFQNPGHLKQHQATHLTEKPFECSQCQLKFTRISSLSRHQKSKHPVASLI